MSIPKSARFAVASVLLLAGVAFVVVRARSSLSNAESDARVYFYDQSEHRLFAASRDTIPPEAGVGGESGDGVRAIVVSPRDNHAATRIAYLETYTLELRERLVAVRDSKRNEATPIKAPSGDDPFVLRHTLVKRESDQTWFDLTTPTAREIIREWQSWRDEAGRPLVIVTP